MHDDRAILDRLREADAREIRRQIRRRVVGPLVAASFLAAVSLGVFWWANTSRGAQVPVGVAGPARQTVEDPERASASTPRVEKDLRRLARDDLRGRESGTAGDDEAGAYIEAELRRLGLQPLFGESYRQPLVIRTLGVDRGGWLSIERAGRTQKIPLLEGVALMGALGGEFRAAGRRVVFAGLGIHEPEVGWDDYAGLDVRDACVAVLYQTPRRLARELPAAIWRRYQDSEVGGEHKLRALVEHGVSCALAISTGDALPFDWDAILSDPAVLDRLELSSPDGVRAMPDCLGFGLTGATARQLFGGQLHLPIPDGRPVTFELQGVRIGYEVDARVKRDRKTFNVGAWLPGTDPSLADEWILFSAHLDGQGMEGNRVLNAANDNAAAAAALLEAGRLLAGRPGRRPVALLFPVAEGPGLLGTLFFVNRTPVRLESIALNANMGMIGTRRGGLRDKKRFRVRGRLTDALERLVRDVETRHGGVELDYALRVDGPDGHFRRADHVNFFLRGVPTIYFYGGDDPNDHRPTDDVDRVDMDKVATMAELLAALVDVADQREVLPRADPDWGGPVPDR